MFFSNKEQQAVLQCLWQLYGANPNKDECEFVQDHITKDWNCTKGVSLNMIELGVLVYDGLLKDLHVNYTWIVCAIGMDPYEAFHMVSNFSIHQKIYFKELVKACVENHGDMNYKTAMAVTLFRNTDVPFGIRGKDWLNDTHNGYQTII